MTDKQTRRRYLVTLSGVGAAWLAGCSASESDRTETSDETATSTGDSSLSATASAEAEATLQQYLEAYTEGDAEAAGSLTHPDSAALGSYTGEADLTIGEIATTTLSAAAEERERDLTDEELETAVEALEEDVADIGAEQHAVVSYVLDSEESGEVTNYALLVRDDGEWSVYKLQTSSYLNEGQVTG